MDDPLLTVKEVAQQMRVAPKTIRRWLAAGQIKGVKVTDRSGWRIRQSEVDRLLREPER